jgi:hypothetical protein
MGHIFHDWNLDEKRLLVEKAEVNASTLHVLMLAPPLDDVQTSVASAIVSSSACTFLVFASSSSPGPSTIDGQLRGPLALVLLQLAEAMSRSYSCRVQGGFG